MSRKSFYGLGTACAALLTASAQSAAAGQPAVLTYFLPTTSVSATVSHRLVSCPDKGDGDVIVATSWSLKSVTGPDYDAPVYIDASTGFLAERLTELTLNPNGTLASINAKAEGQGPAVIEAVLDLAGVVAPMLAGLPPMGSMGDPSIPSPAISTQRCTDEALALLASHARLVEAIATAEELIRKGDASQSQIDQLARDKEALVATRGALTVSQSAATVLGPALGKLDATTGLEEMSGSVLVPTPDISSWFIGGVPDGLGGKVAGHDHGFRIEYAVSKKAASSMRQLGDGNWTADKRDTDLVYRRPVPAQLLAYPCNDSPVNGVCPKDTSAKGRAASASLAFSMPQISHPSRIPVGSAGIFGSRTVAAEFDTNGAPLKLSYGSSPGADGIASSIGAAGEALGEVRDAQLNAIKRQTELLEAEEALRKYREPASDAGQQADGEADQGEE